MFVFPLFISKIQENTSIQSKYIRNEYRAIGFFWYIFDTETIFYVYNLKFFMPFH